jgi:hypothetical protein
MSQSNTSPASPTKGATASASPAPKAGPSRAPTGGAARAMRLQRIYARLQEGFKRMEIAKAEGLSRERVRQILVAARKSDRFEDQPNHAKMQIALTPVLRQAVQAAADGAVGAAKDLFAVLDRLDRYLDQRHNYRDNRIKDLLEGDSHDDRAEDDDDDDDDDDDEDIDGDGEDEGEE